MLSYTCFCSTQKNNAKGSQVPESLKCIMILSVLSYIQMVYINPLSDVYMAKVIFYRVEVLLTQLIVALAEPCQAKKGIEE